MKLVSLANGQCDFVSRTSAMPPVARIPQRSVNLDMIVMYFSDSSVKLEKEIDERAARLMVLI